MRVHLAYLGQGKLQRLLFIKILQLTRVSYLLQKHTFLVH